MEPPDPASKLPPATHNNPRDPNGRKDRSPPAPAGPSGSNPSPMDIVQRDPTGKGGKGKTSTPKKKSSSVKDPSQSSIVQKETGNLIIRKQTLPTEPKVLQRSKSIRRTKRDSTRDSITPTIPLGIGFQSPTPHTVSSQPTMVIGTPESIFGQSTGTPESPNSSLLTSPDQRRANRIQSMRDTDYFFGYNTEDQENIEPMDGSQGFPLSDPADIQFRQEQLRRRSMPQNEVSRHEDQDALARRQTQSQPRIDLNQFDYTHRRVSLPAERFTSQEDRTSQAPQDNVRMEEQETEEQVLSAPQTANWRFYSQFQDPVQGTQRRPRALAQESSTTGERQESHNFIRPAIPRMRPEISRPPRTEPPRQEIPRLIRAETHPPRQREARAQRENTPQATGSQDQALRVQLELTTQIASLQAKVLEARTATVVPTQNDIPVEEDLSEDEYSEEEETDWAGRVIDREDSREVAISTDGFSYWNSLIGIDEAGLKTLKFKRIYKQPLTKIQMFSEGDLVISAPVHNNELPRLGIFDQKKEDDCFTDQKLLAAVATAVCMTVDGARRTVGDLKDTAADFADGRVDDPAKEASRILLATAAIIEDDVLANSIQAVKFIASSFGTISLRRHSLALKAVSDKEAKRVLEKSSPTKDLLFGEKIKESVQQIRDSLQIKKVLRTPFQRTSQRRAPYQTKKSGSYGQYGYRPSAAPGKPRTAQRSPADRFKPGFRGRFGRGRGGGSKKDEEDKDG